VQPLVALPDGFAARVAVPCPGEETAKLGETPHHLAAWGRRRRRVTVLRHRVQRVPLPGCKDNCTGRVWIGPASQSTVVDTPGHEQVNRHGVQSPLLRLDT
jgi:hypothetical protein